MYLKKAWVGEATRQLYSLSLESGIVEPDYNRIKVNQHSYPANPTPEHPLRHVTVIQFLDQNDINKLAQLLDTVRDDP